MKKIYTLMVMVICIIALTNTAIAQCNAPVINSFSPSVGNVGSQVTITGSNFDPVYGNNQVFFGATAATILSGTSTQLVVTVPVGTTYAQLRVKNGCGLSCISPGFFNAIFCPSTVTSSTYGANSVTLACTGSYQMISQDIDGDGKPDLIATTFGGNSIQVYRNTGTGTAFSFASPVNVSFSGYTRCSATGDFDGDGKVDIVTTVTGYGLYILKNNSTSGTISLSNVLYISGQTDPYQCAVADYNLDGKLDICYTNFDSYTYYAMNTTPSGGAISFAAPVALSNTPGYYLISINTADFDGDGLPDIAATSGSNVVVVHRNTTTGGTVSFSYIGAFATNSYPYRLFIGDFDKD